MPGTGHLLRDHVPPQKRVEGRTFEFSFPLPGSAQHKTKSAATPPSKSRRPRKKASSTSGNVQGCSKNKTSRKTLADKAQARREYERTRNKTTERMEYHRLHQKKRGQEAKVLGLCTSCRRPAIPGQTRCETCAEAHRQSRRRNEAHRKSRDQTNGSDRPGRPVAG